MTGIDQLEPGWEILQLAALNRDNQIQSIVRLNKQLAFLQLEGYPIPYTFRVIQMGPASLEINDRARAAEKRGLLKIHETPTSKGKPRVDYELTPEGEAYVRDVVYPTVQADPRGKWYSHIFQLTALGNQYVSNDQLVNEIHRILHHDRDEFEAAYDSAQKRIEALEAESAGWSMRAELDVATGAAVQIAAAALRSIREQVEDPDDDSAGKHLIVCLSERLLEFVALKQEQGGKSRIHDAALIKRFDRLTMAIERIAATYGLLDIPDDEDIEAMFAEAPPLDPKLAT